MAKSSRGGKRGSGGDSAKEELKLPDGSTIEFDGELKYYGNDKTLTGKARQAMEAWEAKRAKAKIEYAYAVDENGNMIDTERKGGKGSVRATLAMHDTPNSTFSHIHPRGDGMLGGTFSDADLTNFANFRGQTARAKAKEGTYSISKTKDFKAKEFKQYVAKAQSGCQLDYSKRMSALNKKFKNSGMSYDDYKKQTAKEFNNFLIDLHNAYKAGEKQYGYTYTLEKN